MMTRLQIAFAKKTRGSVRERRIEEVGALRERGGAEVLVLTADVGVPNEMETSRANCS